MDRIAWMQAFVAVAELEGFGIAARRLGVSPPVVTRSIAALEAHLGARLLERSTRKVRVTEAGERYLVDCRRVLADLEDAEAQVAGAQRALRGQLGVTASVMFGRLFVAPILTEFLDQHESVSARALFVDHVVDMLEERVDVAIRIAKLADSALSGAKVGSVRRVVCASPAFLRKQGVPSVPKDLSDTRCLVFSTERAPPAWIFGDGDKTLSLRPRAALLVNSSEVAIEAAVQGKGVTRALSYMVADHVRRGRLRIVLEDFEPEPLPIHVLHREGARASARVRAFVDLAVARLRTHPALHPEKARQG